MSEEVAFPVIDTSNNVSTNEERLSQRTDAPYTGFASYMGRLLSQKGLFHFLAVSALGPQGSGTEVSGPETPCPDWMSLEPGD